MTAPETTAAPRSSIPIVTDLSRLGRVLFAPGAVFEEQKDAPTFWWPWAIVCVVFVVLQTLQRPFQARVRELMFERLNRPAPPASAAGNAVGMILTPLFVLLLCVIFAGLLYAIVSLLSGETTFKRMLNVLIFTAPVLLITQGITVLVLRMRGIESINGPQDMMVSLGLDLLLPGSAQPGLFLRLILGGIGPLQVWSLAIMATGLGVMARMGRGAAWTAAIIFFAITLLISAGLGSFLMGLAGA